MTSWIFVTIAFTVSNVLAYHDPDLNYHVNQLQNLQNVQNCGDAGYSYPAPSVQLTASGVKAAASSAFAQPQPAYQYSRPAEYATSLAYQPAAPQSTYAAQPAASYQSVISHANYASAPAYTTQSQQREVHGYATSAGLSSASSSGRTVTPLATYAQAPIIAKITAAPLFARFSTVPAKTTYVARNFGQQVSTASGSLARASLNYGAVQSGGPVVTQVFTAPSAGYATSPALRVQQYQQAQVASPVRYTVSGPSGSQYSQAQPISALTPVTQIAPAYRAQYATSVSQVSAPSVAQYSAPAVATQYTQYSAPAVAQQYSTATENKYAGQAQYAQYASPAVAQYAAPAVNHYATPAVAQYASPAVAQYSVAGIASNAQYASAPAAVTHVAAPAAATIYAHSGRVSGASVKNEHTEFLENYDAHPRYAFEYGVNDPHTGDIKQQKEERDGEVVKGQYSLVEPDGSVRTVDYVADWQTGFHANVRNSKDNQH